MALNPHGDSQSDANLEWLGHVQPIGLVIAPRVLSERGLLPAEQTRADTEEAQTVIPEDDAPSDPWAVATTILGWQPALVAGAPGGPALDPDLSAWVPEAETRLAPDWAVQKPGGGWQILAQILPTGIDPDDRRALSGWEATPHQRLERLLRETGIPIGLLISDHAWRLVYAPRGETSGWLRFPLTPLRGVAGRPMLGGFKLLLSRFRLFNDAEPRRLPALLLESRAAQAAVSATLASQVLGALHDLSRGFNTADPERLTALARTRPDHVYEGLLTVLLRLVFLLYAEDRDLIPSRDDAAARGLYARGYGVRGLHARLLEDASRNPDTMNERTGAWGRLLALFRLVHTGDGTGWIRGRGGALFDPAKFPFLQGQDSPDAAVAIPRLSDGTILRVLDRLLVLDGERLSYRTLDVEQIGSVYETVMGFTVIPAPGPSLAIAAGKNNRTPVFVDLTALVARRGKDRIRALKEDYSRAQLSAKQSTAIEAARDEATLAEALRPIVDERGSPGGAITPPGTPLLQPTDERRRSGSHYTPRSLTEPIVRHALEPAFDRIGDDATPDDVLALKVCDPAMGSGAFLVEACRQLATRLVRAWARHRGTRPEIAADEDEDLLARRLVAQRCLYGVDKNPLATDLARLSLWLATLARDHEFTFLDHALKSGDSLVGLTARQIGGLRWKDGQSDVAPFDGFLRDRVRQVTEGRRAIREAPDDVARAIQEQRHQAVEGWTAEVRLLGDATLAAFFGSDKPRARENARVGLGVAASLGPEQSWPRICEVAAGFSHGEHRLRPFHWEVEFPEVFRGINAGFDMMVGNPPFLGGSRISRIYGSAFLSWLQCQFEGSGGRADLVTYFFRRAFELIRQGGTFAFVATNTIAQGDSRESGLAKILSEYGCIYRVTRRLPWPGEAAVIVSVVHVVRGTWPTANLDGKAVARISAYLNAGMLDGSPSRLAANSQLSFKGCYLFGQGFTFDDDAARKGLSLSLTEMKNLISSRPVNGERIFPYLGGTDVNGHPKHAHSRYVIDLGDLTEDQARMRWPDLIGILEQWVKPLRMKDKREANRKYWWRFSERQPALWRAVEKLGRVLAIASVTPHLAFTFLSKGIVYNSKIIIIADETDEMFVVLQGRCHEVWVREFTSTLKDDLNYSGTDCFETFARPALLPSYTALAQTGQTYFDARAALMTTRNEGLTKTYNRFHDPAEHAPDIQRLRDLHHEMDVAVLRAYGWDDLADTAAPEFLTPDTEQDHRYQGRLFWPAPFRDEVLARLLDLNRMRAEEERLLGLSPRDGARVAADSLEDAE